MSSESLATPVFRDTLLAPNTLEALLKEGYAFTSASHAHESLRVDRSDLDALARCWDGLMLDRYMADGGEYRLRRYGSFICDPVSGELTQRPHEPYFQARYINRLNGGIERHFEPLELRFVANPLLRNLLLGLALGFNRLRGNSRWLVRLHPYRILAAPGAPGLPSPEGIHRDGVDFIITVMIHRENVSGGESCVYDDARNALFATTLATPLEHLILDDRRMLHDVTPVVNVDPGAASHRDMLVLAYERLGARA